MADRSDWMIKPYCAKRPNPMMSSSAAMALTCAVFQELELVGDRHFFVPGGLDDIPRGFYYEKKTAENGQ